MSQDGRLESDPKGKMHSLEAFHRCQATKPAALPGVHCLICKISPAPKVCSQGRDGKRGASKEVFVGEARQLSFLRQGQMGLVISLVTCIVVGLEEDH